MGVRTRCKICGNWFEQMDRFIEEDICPECWDEINGAIQDSDESDDNLIDTEWDEFYEED